MVIWFIFPVIKIRLLSKTNAWVDKLILLILGRVLSDFWGKKSFYQLDLGLGTVSKNSLTAGRLRH